jgi:hypothetical protein
MQASITPPPVLPFILENLPTLEFSGQVCPRRSRIQLDFLLIALESLDLDAAEHFKGGIHELQLGALIKNRVALWQVRNSNPLRRASQRRNLSLSEAQALVVLTCYLAKRQTAQIRQLLLMHAQLQDKDLTPDYHYQLSQYLERFRGHFRSRMNPNRSAIAAYQTTEALNTLALSLLQQALFCTGSAGMQRLWTSLFDGEVA